MESDLRKKLQIRQRERNLRYGSEELSEGVTSSILGTSSCWFLCIAIALFIYLNTFLSNNISSNLIAKMEIYIDGSKDFNLQQNLINWLKIFRS
jgi:hypothetical protein